MDKVTAGRSFSAKSYNILHVLYTNRVIHAHIYCSVHQRCIIFQGAVQGGAAYSPVSSASYQIQDKQMNQEMSSHFCTQLDMLDMLYYIPLAAI
jgi:hypothetical protein